MEEAVEAPAVPPPAENLYPEEWPSTGEAEEGPTGVFEVPDEVPGPRTPPSMRFLATSAKYGGVPTLLLSSGSSQSISDSELRARLQRHSSAAASDASWEETQVQESPSPPRRRMPRLPIEATASGAVPQV